MGSRDASLPDLERDLPTSVEDVLALRRARGLTHDAFPDLSELPGAHASLANRATGAGREPLTL